MLDVRAVMQVGIANPRWRANIPGIPDACATRNHMYLARGPLDGVAMCCARRMLKSTGDKKGVIVLYENQIVIVDI